MPEGIYCKRKPIETVEELKNLLSDKAANNIMRR